MERIVAENGVVYYRSSIIPCVHGFSTRVGGVSELPHTKGLNLGLGRGDDDAIVTENLKLFSEAVGFPYDSIISVEQIHSDKIRYVTPKNCGEGMLRPSGEPCDGYITDTSGIALAVRTADCVPVLLYAPPNEKFNGAVMALHAGWRGTASKIVIKAVERAIALGANVTDIRGAIGPSIGKCCYEVRDDFYNEFKLKAGDRLAEKYITPDGKREGYFYADLKGANKELLMSCGIAEKNIDVAEECTCCMPHEFFSHRYSHGVRGTMLSVICMDMPRSSETFTEQKKGKDRK